ncbi:probable rRNA maturation factor [Kushneria avicenniae]|uniref:Endoribonuclease YbeY n=1 Tax=Kushneria avicenniae TaxID=402385 RepID=A0A1I1MNN9_9GAMM|nr:rRNA maturation RNase YbeY [Kushneria avicenniae]SFC83160.1 probable rRNA maturation factor [Kushneria avicenniae]
MSDAVCIDRQVAVDFEALPEKPALERWLLATLKHFPGESRREMTVRFTSEEESQSLNHDYRGRDSSTNVLSFPFEAPPGVPLPLLGDLVISPHVVAREALEQHKRLEDHFAHMIVHGTLHLLGLDHIDDDDAEAMEQLERDILSTLGIADPYAVAFDDVEAQDSHQVSEEKRTDA